MPSPLFLLLLLLPFGVACSGPGDRGASQAAPGAVDPAAIKPLEEQLRQAIVASDTGVLSRLWAPEYLSTSAVGHTSNRSESLMAYGAGLVNVDTAAVRDVDVRVYGSTAVSLGLLEWAGTAAGRPFGGTVRFQHIWVWRNGVWQLVASQLTSQR